MEMGKVARRLCLGLLFGGMSCVGNEAGAVVKLPSLVGDRMVLQRETDLKIWGWADPGEKVTVRFRGAHYYTEADGQGRWHVMLPPQLPGGPFLMEVNEKVIRDVLVGDVFLCGGQSNQENPIERLVEKFPEIPVSNNHMIRHFKVPYQDDVRGVKENLAGSGVWHSATASEVMNWTSLAYFFATEVYNRYKVPVGMLVSSKGGVWNSRILDQPGTSEGLPQAAGRPRGIRGRSRSQARQGYREMEPEGFRRFRLGLSGRAGHLARDGYPGKGKRMVQEELPSSVFHGGTACETLYGAHVRL